MTNDLDISGESASEMRKRRIFRLRIWLGAAGYLLASFALYQWGHGTSPWRIVWAVLPVLFVAWIVTVAVLRIRQMDEYQIRLFFPGLAVGFTVTIFAAVTLGTLSAAGLAVPNAGWPVALLGIAAWEVTNLIVRAPIA